MSQNNLETRIMFKSNLLLNNTKLEVDMKDLKKMVFDMGEESSFIKMVDIMMDNGKGIKCMDGVNYTMKEDN